MRISVILLLPIPPRLESCTILMLEAMHLVAPRQELLSLSPSGLRTVDAIMVLAPIKEVASEYLLPGAESWVSRASIAMGDAILRRLQV